MKHMFMKISKYVILLAVLLSISYVSATAQSVYQAWAKIVVGNGYSGYNDNYGLDIYYSPKLAVTPSGDVYLAYGIYDSISGMDIALSKYSPDGNEVWTSYYRGQGTSDDRPGGITLDDSGTVYLIGQTWDATNSLRGLIIKFGVDGGIVWTSNIIRGEPRAVDIDKFGNIYVAFSAYGYVSNNGWYDYASVKFTSSGDTAWMRHYAGPGNFHDVPTDIELDDSGNVYVTGYSDSIDACIYDYFTVKYSSAGDELWAQRYQTPNLDTPYSLKLDTYGNVYVTGFTNDAFSGPTLDYTTIKYSPDGQVQWTNKFISGYWEITEPDYVPNRMVIDDSGYIYVVGTTFDAIQDTVLTGYDYVLLKLNQNGDTVWVKYVSSIGNSDDDAISMTIDNDGIIYITGRSLKESDPTHQYDCLTVAYSSSGDLLWQMRFDSTDGGGWQLPRSIATDTLGNVYVTGVSWGDSANSGFFIIKYSPIITAVKNNESVVSPSSWSLSQNYPNPFNPSTNIHFNLPTSGHVSLDIFNILGQRVKTLVDENLTAGYRQIIWDGTDQSGNKVATGIYFYRLLTKDFSQTKKMVFLK